MQIKSIMIVDDSEADQFLTSHIIEEFDSSIEIHNAYNGQEALDQLAILDEPPTVILLDINMPLMNGFEFLEEYSSLEKTSSVIAMLTSSEQELDKEKIKEYACVKGYFSKPLDFSDFDFIKTLPK